jgi:hypothetical protein
MRASIFSLLLLHPAFRRCTVLNVPVVPEDSARWGWKGGALPKNESNFERVQLHQAFSAKFPQHRRLIGAFKSNGCEGKVEVALQGTETSPPLSGPTSFDWDSNGALWVANSAVGTVTRIGSVHSEKTVEALVFGNKGQSAGLFPSPSGLAINSKDIVYVTDKITNELLRIYPDGNVEKVLTIEGGLTGSPVAIDVDSYDNIFIACVAKDSILKLVHPSGPLVVVASRMSKPQVLVPQTLCVDLFDKVHVANGNSDIISITSEGRVYYFVKTG